VTLADLVSLEYIRGKKRLTYDAYLTKPFPMIASSFIPAIARMILPDVSARESGPLKGDTPHRLENRGFCFLTVAVTGFCDT
jgi:hypothetical protein